ncbi:vasoactive intestinal polypeptide receptor 1-like isoform X2 [Brienomyrus brachyistius]|uniref:vasoactive intestinal polypeptide receptor 1-like isoform X2 n=1 Tax=Brienomyrus brachyistius TaxID=42636 RepID=UPI0020B24FC5|nr:vasoactive intestinal polypeptide receptor 1-like isoform X2 [Brienomyrus brachyistius]
MGRARISSNSGMKISIFHLWLHLTFWGLGQAIHPDCAIISQHMKAQELCLQIRRREAQNRTTRTGCRTEWDEIRCWPRADVGQVVNVSCSEIFLHFSSSRGYISRNCTADGWTDLQPSYEEACDFSKGLEPVSEVAYLSTFRHVYTAGYATSLVSLITAVFMLIAFRKFHCTRNYIHINLFASFILRASAVFIKDAVLFADENLDHCFMSTFSILANYFWLLVEGMYLQTLLALTFVSHRKYFWWYIVIGWGVPSAVLTVWVLTRYFTDDRGCWDDTENVAIWWIIKAPITASLLVNFIIFISVIRILMQKLRSPAAGGCDVGHFMRLAKSTLFLIPLFGTHYMVFAFLPETVGEAARLYIELGLGSFQGFVVALLYCFLNGEVQAEMRRRLSKWQMSGRPSPVERRKPPYPDSSLISQVTVLDKPVGRGPSCSGGSEPICGI